MTANTVVMVVYIPFVLGVVFWCVWQAVLDYCEFFSLANYRSLRVERRKSVCTQRERWWLNYSSNKDCCQVSILPHKRNGNGRPSGRGTLCVTTIQRSCWQGAPRGKAPANSGSKKSQSQHARGTPPHRNNLPSPRVYACSTPGSPERACPGTFAALMGVPSRRGPWRSFHKLTSCW